MIKCRIFHPESEAEWMEEFDTAEQIVDYQEENPEYSVIELCEFYDDRICHYIWLNGNTLCDKGHIKGQICPRVRNIEASTRRKLKELKNNGRLEL